MRDLTVQNQGCDIGVGPGGLTDSLLSVVRLDPDKADVLCGKGFDACDFQRVISLRWLYVGCILTYFMDCGPGSCLL